MARTQCWNCSGTGKVDCYFCKGNGGDHDSEGTWQQCRQCYGSGKGTCHKCSGAGFVEE